MELYKTVKTTAPFISSEEWCVQKISQQIREDELGFSAVECFYCWSRLRYPWKERDVGGYPIPQYRKKDWQIPKYCVKNRPNTDTTVTIGHVYLKLYPSRVFVYLHHVCTRTTSDIARKRENTLSAIHSTKISGNFGLKLNLSVRSNRKSFEKTGPPFEVDHFSPGRTGRSFGWMVRAPWLVQRSKNPVIGFPSNFVVDCVIIYPQI